MCSALAASAGVVVACLGCWVQGDIPTRNIGTEGEGYINICLQMEKTYFYSGKIMSREGYHV